MDRSERQSGSSARVMEAVRHTLETRTLIEFRDQLEAALLILSTQVKTHIEKRVGEILSALDEAEQKLFISEKGSIRHIDQNTAEVWVERQQIDSANLNMAGLEQKLKQSVAGNRGDMIVAVDVRHHGADGSPHGNDEISIIFKINLGFRLNNTPVTIA